MTPVFPDKGNILRRYLVLLAAVLMQTCLGATYSWSVFVAPLKTLCSLSQGAAQLPFSVFYIVFPATMIFSGTLLSRFGPRRCAMAGGVLFGGGWLLASLGESSFALTILGIGALAGMGVGMAYMVPITTCMQWFPKHKGLVTGIAVAGFGGGAALVSQVAGRMLSASDASPFEVFRLLGLVFLILVALGGSFMKDPDGKASGASSATEPMPVRTMKEFGILYTAMFAEIGRASCRERV